MLLDNAFATASNVLSDWSGLAHQRRFIERYSPANPVPYRLLGIGCSVSKDANGTLSARNSPVALLAAAIELVFGIDVEFYDGGVSGTVVFEAVGASGDMADAIAAAQVAFSNPTWSPDGVYVNYIMNDGLPGSFHAGQTLPGVATYTARLTKEIRALPADAIFGTDPHPHTGRASWAMPMSGGVPIAPSWPLNGSGVTRAGA